MTKNNTASLSALESFTLESIGPNGSHFQTLSQGALRSLESKGLVVVGRDLIARTAANHALVFGVAS